MNWILAVTLLFNGILAGLSLDKVIVQLPARGPMGVIDYARYARAADLRNGVVFYAVTGVGAAVRAGLQVAAISCGSGRGNRAPSEVVPLAEAFWWHPLYREDPAHAWLRRLLSTAARTL
jgi:hypothetical protein